MLLHYKKIFFPSSIYCLRISKSILSFSKTMLEYIQPIFPSNSLRYRHLSWWNGFPILPTWTPSNISDECLKRSCTSDILISELCVVVLRRSDRCWKSWTYCVPSARKLFSPRTTAPSAETFTTSSARSASTSSHRASAPCAEAGRTHQLTTRLWTRSRCRRSTRPSSAWPHVKGGHSNTSPTPPKGLKVKVANMHCYYFRHTSLDYIGTSLLHCSGC